MRRRWLAPVLFLAACAQPPRPAVLAEVDRTRAAAAAQEAASLSPQAFLAAEKLRGDALQAYEDGDRPSAQILAEHALAAYAHARALARLARADDRLAAATRRADSARRDFASLEEQQRRVAAEADDAETRFRVARDALPVLATEPAKADRELARLGAARALALEARLLCVATQMLIADTPGLIAAFQSLGELDTEIQKKPTRAPLDAAVRLRSACMTELTLARRGAASRSLGPSAADALLDELGRASLEPRRDDRGVTITLRDAFQGTTLTPTARERLTALGQVGKAHPTFPLLVVVHAGRGSATPRDAARGEAVKKALVEAGAPRVETKAGGDALPVAPPQQTHSAARNERIEIVFVAPSP